MTTLHLHPTTSGAPPPRHVTSTRRRSTSVGLRRFAIRTFSSLYTFLYRTDSWDAVWTLSPRYTDIFPCLLRSFFRVYRSCLLYWASYSTSAYAKVRASLSPVGVNVEHASDCGWYSAALTPCGYHATVGFEPLSIPQLERPQQRRTSFLSPTTISSRY
ncbi:hypothetical protein PENSPDRAFT_202303 [Peniophora sp. CONT]|nr:hypothetical protein PENSPDRAFT_202303 [Peniophora sp. CONT]